MQTYTTVIATLYLYLSVSVFHWTVPIFSAEDKHISPMPNIVVEYLGRMNEWSFEQRFHMAKYISDKYFSKVYYAILLY